VVDIARELIICRFCWFKASTGGGTVNFKDNLE
jgi:hypothetical protein